ncbi:MAG: hypothetical protein V1806_16615, partial [Pseudomonadota bacterium]
MHSPHKTGRSAWIISLVLCFCLVVPALALAAQSPATAAQTPTTAAAPSGPITPPQGAPAGSLGQVTAFSGLVEVKVGSGPWRAIRPEEMPLNLASGDAVRTVG